MSKSNPRIIIRSIVIALIVLSVIAYFLIICWKGLGGTYIEDGWQVTRGTILSSDVELSGRKNIERKNQGLMQTINYEYKVNDVPYKSNSVSKETFVLVGNFPEGKVVDVFFNPTDVTDSVLVRSIVQKQYLYAMMGFCMIVVLVTLTFLIKDIKGALNN